MVTELAARFRVQRKYVVFHGAFKFNFSIDLGFANNLFFDYFRILFRGDFRMLGVGWTLQQLLFDFQ